MRPEAHTRVPPGLVALPVAGMLISEMVAWALLSLPGTLDGPSWYGRPTLLVAVHLVTVGTLGLAILGTGWQLVPVVTARQPPGWWAPLARVSNLLTVGGAGLLFLGLARPGLLGAIGGSLVLAGLLARSVGVAMVLFRAQGRPVTRLWLLLAEGCLWVGLVLGALLYAGRAGWLSVLPPIAGVGHHAALLLGGWVGGWMLGLGGLLLPMFAVSPEPRPLPWAMAAICWFGGIAFGLPVLWAIGGGIAVLVLGAALRRRARRQLEPGLLGAGLALLALLALSGLVALRGLDAGAAALGLGLWALPFLRGVALKILPFLAEVHLFSGQMRGAPPVQALTGRRLPALCMGASVLGGLGLLLGLLAGSDLLSQAGALSGLAGSLLLVFLVLRGLRRGLTARNRLRTLPGMETR